MKQTRAEKLIDKRIDVAYRATCTGIQINMMDISRVFTVGRNFLTVHPEATDDELSTEIHTFVQTIRQN